MEISKLHSLFLNSSGVSTDTRHIRQDSIFFALKGEKFNANKFAEEAFQKGAEYVVVDEIAEDQWKEKFDDKLVLVEDVLRTLQQLAAYHRDLFKCPVLGITGSNGKTTTKELVAAVLSKRFKTYATIGNLNNHIGIPLTLLAVGGDAEFVIVEMGANHKGEIASYCEYAKPDFGLITNVGLAHTEGFGGFEGVVKGKTELYRYLLAHEGRIFVSADNDLLLDKIPDLKSAITYGSSSKAFCKGELVAGEEFLSVRIEGTQINTNLIGDYNFENVMSAVCIGNFFGVELHQIKDAIENYIPSNNRSQKITYRSNTIILDAYNANPSSMKEALKNFEKLKAERKTVILGEMMELGDVAEAEHRKIVQTLKEKYWEGAHKVFVGRGFQFLQNEPNDSADVKWFATTDEVKRWFLSQDFQNEYILIKGSRKNELEKILKD